MMRKRVKEWLSNGDTSSSEFLLCWSLICLPFVRFDWKQTWAIEWFVFLFSSPFSRNFFLSFSFFSHTMSFFCQIRTSSFLSCIFSFYVQPPRRRGRRWRPSQSVHIRVLFLFFSFLHTVTYTHSIYSFTLRWREKEKKKETGRTFATTAIIIRTYSLRYSSLQ